jgi:5-carboxymethyl-2-hydroxymuconate isomerase
MIRIHGIREKLDPLKAQLSDIINSCMVDALAFPEDKRAHRFFPMEAEDFYFPTGRTEAYLVIEVSMIAGRSEAARKKLIQLLFERIEKQAGIDPIDVEIMIFELPACNFGFRGMTGDEAVLNYKIDV